MEYAVQPSPPGYLEVTISGVPSFPEVQAMLREILAQRGGRKAALMQVKVAHGLDFFSIQQLIDDLPRLGFPPDFRFAVFLLDDQARRSAHFAQEAGENRGVAIQVFFDRDAALHWLLS